ncbi:CapA family protein [Vibrio vulnificus]|nr:CapA family protein [Vibrio vulnificus]ELR8704293.1 CapA family protein [Vibrio vulnificus]ELR8772537.1 CapA family protein [Vibrio vulnificus]
MKICFCGDLFLGGDLSIKNNIKIDEVVNFDEFRNADLRVVNLEQPISDNEIVSDKCTLYTGSESIELLKEMNINVANLANNHIHDKGLEGISETIEHLNSNEISFFGAGSNINSARAPIVLTEGVKIFGYCDYDRSYLSQIAVADENNPGVNPLRHSNILNDLSMLSDGEKAVLYFHWGREHVWCPEYNDIKLVKLLLEDDRVLTIIGMHCHRIQGIIKHNNKKAYMSLGNFLFPNFYIKEPTQIFYPNDEEKSNIKFITKRYHNVFLPTYKIWKIVNRISMVITYDTKTNTFKEKFVYQEELAAKLNGMNKIQTFALNLFVCSLSIIYKLPKPVYLVVQKLNVFISKASWRFGINNFLSRQVGWRKIWFPEFKRILSKVGVK